MFLKKLTIYDFRVLHKVNLDFEQEFTPSIFPLGSLNGGGKSTLLQFIFVLLHCSFHKDRHPYLTNMLGALAKKTTGKVRLAKFDISHDDVEFTAEYIIHSNVFNDLNLDLLDVKTLKEIHVSAKNIQLELNDLELTEASLDINEKVTKLIQEYNNCSGDSSISKRTRGNAKYYEQATSYIIAKVKSFSQDNNTGKLVQTRNIHNALQNENLLYISHLSKDKVLLCKTPQDRKFMTEIASKVYLASPSTQIILFLSKEEKGQLFSTEKQSNSYIHGMSKAKNGLPGLFTYDYEYPEMITKIFKKARDHDTEKLLHSGSYGDSLKKLKEQMDNFLFDKTITTSTDFARVIFKRKHSEDELLPEDLSHGELKKLSIYLWLSSLDINDSLVLMDEIELGMHPDWQYEIINDLQDWSKGNHFILATHSYDLCNAVTPAHVKELEPNLINK